MNIKYPSARKAVFILGVALIAGLGLGAYFAFQRPPRVAMTRYVPADSLAFGEVYNLGDLVDGLTSTKAWRELAPVLSLSSQLRKIGPLVSLLGRTGLGPDEAVLAGRSQIGIAVTGLEAGAGSAEDGPYVRLKPHFAVIIETHSSSALAERVVRDKVGIVARRIFGDSAAEESDSYQGIELHIFHGQEPARRLLAASTGSLILIANDPGALESCLDAIAGRVPNLGDDQVLMKFRPVVDREAAVFGYLTTGGIDKLSVIGPAILASRFTTDPERMDAVASLFQHISGQALSGLLYAAQFTAEGVTDRYLTVTTPRIASGMSETLTAAASPTDRNCLKFVPRSAEDFTLVNIEGLGGVPQRALKRISPGLDVVGALALREFVIGFFERLGASSPDQIEKGLGDQMALVKFNQQEIATVAEIKDNPNLAVFIRRYLEYRGARVLTENYKGVEISISSAEDGRAAAFRENYVLMGPPRRICQMIDAAEGAGSYEQVHPGTGAPCDGASGSVGDDARIVQALSMNSAHAPVVTCSPCPREAAALMLEISRLTRTTDGSPDILQQDEAKRAFERLPPSVSFTEFKDIGVYTETRSAIGNLSLIVTLGSGD